MDLSNSPPSTNYEDQTRCKIYVVDREIESRLWTALAHNIESPDMLGLNLSIRAPFNTAHGCYILLAEPKNEYERGRLARTIFQDPDRYEGFAAHEIVREQANKPFKLKL